MATLTIRKLDAALKERLRVRAAQHGHSMEAEAREILKDTLTQSEPSGLDLYRSIRRRFEPFGGVDLELPPRTPAREPPSFD
jgi:plasmid stability protein